MLLVKADILLVKTDILLVNVNTLIKLNPVKTHDFL
jgi:hypothetical protein